MLRKVFPLGVLIFFFVMHDTGLHAQPFPQRNWWMPGAIPSLPTMDSLHSKDSLGIVGFDFQHALSLYTWSSSLRLLSNLFGTSNPLAPSFSISAEGRSRFREDTRVRTSEANALLNADYPFDIARNGITLSFFGTTYSISAGAGQALVDIGTLTNVTDGYGVLGGKFFPTSKIEITAGGGIAHKSFEVGTSSGTIFTASILSDTIRLSDENTFDGAAVLDERHFTLSDERSRNDNVHAHLFSNFGESGMNDASGGITLQRRDFFFTKDTSGTLAKQERSELAFELHDALQYPFISNRLIGNFRADISPRQITRRTPSIDITSLPTTTLTTSTFLVPSTTNSLDANLSGKLDLLLGDAADTSRMTLLSAEMKFNERSETSDVLHGETGTLSTGDVQKLSEALGQTSFDGKLTSLGLSASIPVAERDALRADFTSRIYRYDTPSSDNHDDRDELNLGASLQYHHYFSSLLETISELRLAKAHLVYLAGDRSLQNYISKTIAFSSEVSYRTPSFQHRLHGEVFANYSVYDFAAPVTSLDGARDYLIRGVNGSDSIRISLGRLPVIWDALTAIEGIFDLRLYERGAYNSDAFTERPVLSTTEFSGDLTLNLTDRRSQSPALIKVGARTFILRRFAPNSSGPQNDLLLQERLDRIGPLLIMIIDQFAVKGPRLYASLWYSFVTDQTPDANITSKTRQIEARLAVQWSF